MTDCLRFDRFELRPHERLLLRDGQPVHLGARAFDLLLTLAAHRDRLVTKAELLDRAWPGLVVEEGNIQVQVSALRKLLGPRAIATIPGLGYRLAVAPEPAGSTSPPAAAEGAACPSNLPASLEPLIGREEDLRGVDRLLEAHRLVTLVGPGGVGKTSLALDAAGRRRCAALDGLWWVDVAPLCGPEQVVPCIAMAARLSIGGSDPAAGLGHALGARRVLLVLDNAEHLAAPLASLLQALLQRAAGLRVLVTSQQALRVPGEQLHVLAPLAVPWPGDSLEAARACAAVQLLERRAQAIDRRFVVSASNLAPTIELCRQLDGMPLALEMAAARLPILGFQGLQPLLAAPLDRLKALPQETPDRQRSLRRTLEWSHALLGADEQTLLRRLSVFAGSFRLEVARHAAGYGSLDGWTALDALAGLVDKSLVKLVEVDPPRYRLLETTRLYAAEQLAVHGEGQEMQARHARAMAEFVEAELPRVRHEPAARWQASFAADYDDLARAFEGACRRGDADVAAAVLLPLRQIDQLRGLFSSSARRVAGAQALLARAGTLGQARLHTFIASCGWTDPPQGSRVDSARRAVALWRGLDRVHDLHGALAIAATETARVGGHAEAEALLAEARSLERPDWPTRAQVVRLVHEGWVAGFGADPARCCERMQAALQLCERDHEPELALAVRVLLAGARLDNAEFDSTITLARELLDTLRASDQTEYLGVAWCLLCVALLANGEHADARAAAAQALTLTQADGMYRIDLLRAVAVLAVDAGDWANAAHLFGHADAAADEAPPAQDCLGGRVQAAQKKIDAALGAQHAAALRAAGARLRGEGAERLAAASLARQGGPEPDRQALFLL